jgi:ATP/ADP translocase
MVVGVWSISGVASVVTHQLQTLEVVTPVMMLVTGFLFGYQVKINKTKKEDDEAQSRREV